MKMRGILLFIPLLLSGCGSKSYEEQAGLTPLVAPVKLAGALVTPFPDRPPVRSTDGQGVSKIAIWEEKINGAASKQEIDSTISQLQFGIKSATILWPMIIGNDSFSSERSRNISEGITFLERAAIIKAKELESGDNKDSTGEVVKYLDYARICDANLATLPTVK